MGASAVTRAGSETIDRIQAQLNTLRGILLLLNCSPDSTLGLELEFQVVKHGKPLLHSILMLLQLVKDPRVVAELGSSTGEINFTWTKVSGKPFSTFLAEAKELIGRIRDAVRKIDPEADIVFIGTLPTTTCNDVALHNLTPYSRYGLLQRVIWTTRPPRMLTLVGPNGQLLHHVVRTIGPEAKCTSVQPHLYVAGVDPVEVNNTIVAMAGPMQALFGNAAFTSYFQGGYDIRYWLMAAGTADRVFVNGYCSEALEPFAASANTNTYPVILTAEDEEAAARVREGLPLLRSLMTQHGTVWPAIGRTVYDRNAAHLRLEVRHLSAGPVVTMLAATALLTGLLHNPAARELWRHIPEGVAKANFAVANRKGVHATIKWPDANGRLRFRNACDVALELLETYAYAGLATAGVEPSEAEVFLAPAKASAIKRQSGAWWQIERVRYLRAHGLNLEAAVLQMTQEYIALCDGGLGPHFTKWPNPTKGGIFLSLAG